MDNLLSRKASIGILVVLTLLIGVTLGEFYLTPGSFFASPIYWAGLFVFALVGAFLYGATSDKIAKPVGVSVAVLVLVLAYFSRIYPPTLDFALGFPGMFVGMALRIAYLGFCKKA